MKQKPTIDLVVNKTYRIYYGNPESPMPLMTLTYGGIKDAVIAGSTYRTAEFTIAFANSVREPLTLKCPLHSQSSVDQVVGRYCLRMHNADSDKAKVSVGVRATATEEASSGSRR
jgi:hypothetical protein